MITKDGKYWSTGISLQWRERSGGLGEESRSGWSAELDFLDNGFANDDADARQISTEGTLRTRYFVRDGEVSSGLSTAIDTLIEDAGRLSIVFRSPNLYLKGDGEDEDFPAPEGWRGILAREARRIGWETPYTAAEPLAR